MAGDNHGHKTQEESQAQEDLGQQQAAQEKPQVSGADWEKAVDGRKEKIAELKAQGENDRIDFRLQLTGVHNMKAARAVLGDHGDDVDKLMEAEPWLFADAPAKQQGGKTGLPNAGTTTGAGKIMKHWCRLAVPDDSNDNV